MSRRFLDNVRADLTALLTTGGLTPAPALNLLLQDLMDSTIQDECAVAGDAEVLGIVTATTFQPITTAYNQDIGGDGDFLNPNFTLGEVVTSITPGFSYNIIAEVSLTDLGNNVPIDFVVLKNGVETGFVSAVTGRGSGRPINASFRHINISGGASDVYTIGVRTPNGADTIDILSIALIVIIEPTNNP